MQSNAVKQRCSVRTQNIQHVKHSSDVWNVNITDLKRISRRKQGGKSPFMCDCCRVTWSEWVSLLTKLQCPLNDSNSSKVKLISSRSQSTMFSSDVWKDEITNISVSPTTRNRKNVLVQMKSANTKRVTYGVPEPSSHRTRNSLCLSSDSRWPINYRNDEKCKTKVEEENKHGCEIKVKDRHALTNKEHQLRTRTDWWWNNNNRNPKLRDQNFKKTNNLS